MEGNVAAKKNQHRQLIGVCDRFDERYPKWEWICSAIERIGHSYVRIKTQYMFEKCIGMCDAILFSQAYPVPHGHVMRLSGLCPFAIWCFDYLHPRLPLLDSLPWGSFDYVFSKTPWAIGKHPRSLYLDQACPWHWVARTNPDDFFDREYDIIFPATRTTNRELLVKKVLHVVTRHGGRMAVAGRGWDGVHGLGCDVLPEQRTDDEMYNLFASARSVLCSSHIEGSEVVPGYSSDRFWLAVAAGATSICDDSVELAMNKDWLLDERDYQRKALCTYEQRVDEILRTVFDGESSIQNPEVARAPG